MAMSSNDSWARSTVFAPRQFRVSRLTLLSQVLNPRLSRRQRAPKQMQSELMTLRTLIQKKLRHLSLRRNSPDYPLEGDILQQAAAAGLTVEGGVTLMQLSDIVDLRLRAEILAAYGAEPSSKKSTPQCDGKD